MKNILEEFKDSFTEFEFYSLNYSIYFLKSIDSLVTKDLDLLDEQYAPYSYFQNKITESKELLSKFILNEDDLLVIDDPVFYMRYEWSWNYHMNFIESLPNIVTLTFLLKKVKNLKVVVQENFKLFYMEIFELFGLKNVEILSLNSNIKFSKLYLGTFHTGYRNDSENLHAYQIFICQYMRYKLGEKLKNTEMNHRSKNLYIRRDNFLTGFNRYIKNDDQLTLMLTSKYNFDVAYFESQTILEKFQATLDYEVVISPIGANLVNFFFSENSKIKKFILLVGKNCINNDLSVNNFVSFNIKQLIILGNIEASKIHVLVCDFEENGISTHDSVNRPYIVSLSDVEKYICDDL